MAFLDKLRGHRTKIIAAILILQVIVRAIDGSIEPGDAITQVLAALGLLAARAPGAAALEKVG